MVTGHKEYFGYTVFRRVQKGHTAITQLAHKLCKTISVLY